MNIIELNNIYKTYGYGENKVNALNDVSLTVENGEFIAITGMSGSGKSTLLNVIGGLEQPEKGKVLLEKTSVYDLKEKERIILRRRRIGFVFQFFNLIESMNVYENIVLPLRLDGRKIDNQFIDEIIEMLGLEEKRYSYIEELSGGQQQRVAIARALACKPAILLCDEPTGNLDSKNAKEVIELLKLSQRQYHQTIIMVTHEHSLALKADRILVMRDGKLGDENV
jgi:putative ABC transport system ATP-binding protein